MVDLILKYSMWHPAQAARMLYYNFCRIRRMGKRAYLVLAKRAVIDADRTADIVLSSSVVLGWCNMKRSRLETALCMGRNSKIFFGGVKITDKYWSAMAHTYRWAMGRS